MADNAELAEGANTEDVHITGKRKGVEKCRWNISCMRELTVFFDAATPEGTIGAREETKRCVF